MKFRNGILLFFFSIVSLIVIAQDEGIQFVKGLSWKQIVAEAKTQNKFIFMDCYATWCGPCKFMNQNVFSTKEAGDFFNSHFINVSVQMNQTDKDSKEIKLWRKDAASIEVKYPISAYPTYLFFAPNGEAVHRIAGAVPKPADFIEQSKDAFDPSKQYYTLMRDFRKHAKDSAFLRNALHNTMQVHDRAMASVIADMYIQCVSAPLAKENLQLLQPTIHSPDSKCFRFFLDHLQAIQDILGRQGRDIPVILASLVVQNSVDPLFDDETITVFHTNKIIKDIQLNYPALSKQLEDIANGHFRSAVIKHTRQLIFKKDAPLADWNLLAENFKKVYPDLVIGKLMAEQKPDYYAYKEMWPECAENAIAYLNVYGAQLSYDNINNLVWDYVFMHSSNQVFLNQALEWSQKCVLEAPSEYIYMDSYANLLYKTGSVKLAIEWEKKAVQLVLSNSVHVDTENLAEFKDNLGKMEKGEKTWADTQRFRSANDHHHLFLFTSIQRNTVYVF